MTGMTTPNGQAKAKWLRNHVALFHSKGYIHFLVRSVGRKEGWKEGGRKEREWGRKGRQGSPSKEQWWSLNLCFVLPSTSELSMSIRLEPGSFLHFNVVLGIEMKCWFHHKPAWKQVHYIIHIFILAEITFQLFICFDVSLLQETIAWK